MGYSKSIKYKCFCVVDSNYIDQALLSIKSYFEHNTFPVTLYKFGDFDYVSKNKDILSDKFYKKCLETSKRLSILKAINDRRDYESLNI